MTWRQELRQLIAQRTGIEVPETASSLDTLVNERVKALALSNPQAYLRQLFTVECSSHEWGLVFNVVTNRLTHFFRDADQLSVIGTELDSQRRTLGERPLQLWSAGCSSGEEAYTLAIVCKQRDIKAEILGTDVNHQVIATARAGRYPSWALRHVHPELVESYFDIQPDGVYIPTSEICQMVYFSQHNLVTEKAPSPRDCSSGWDVILCRNVLIYYSKTAITQIARALVTSLNKSGVLLLGASESLRNLQVSVMVDIIDGRLVYRPDSPILADIVKGRSVYRPDSPNRIIPTTSTSNRIIPTTRPVKPVEPEHNTQLETTLAPSPTALNDLYSYLQVQESLIEYIQADRFDSAVSCLKEVVSHNPKDLVARMSLGHSYLLLHDFIDATECYSAVASLDPLLSETHFFMGIVERKRRRLEIAIKWLKKAVFLEPTFWAASYLLSTTALRLGKTAIWEREWKRTAALVNSGRGTLPMVSHPVLHVRFIPDPNEVLGSYCYTTTIVEKAG